ncbi:exodeoxyribonuclease VII large subunit [Odoribacter sp. OttesenSCG-928-A06]|nr:exodeoxyribonuclease VII large subunit [Odoribacter sp. OttesenSCG-928-A06]
MEKGFISLFELNKQIKQVLKKEFSTAIWITAEISSVQENRSGHCYLELADKSDKEDKTVAVAKATIWSFTYGMLKTYFTSVTGRVLEKGMKVLVCVEVVYHELYGFSLNIKDIDPTFTIGDLERKKREILEQLEKDGVIDMNKELEFPLLPKTIAVISSPTAAGYGDFVNQLQKNTYSYKFHIHLFPALMQGDQTTSSVISALERIYEYEDLFDVVVIIRGGGSQTDLGSFDSYDLAANVAQFPLPVIAGIGHDRDETIVDRVAYISVKTPTAAAAFLIECFHELDAGLETRQEEFVQGVSALIRQERNKQTMMLMNFKRLTQSMLENSDGRLKIASHKIDYASALFMDRKRKEFEHIRHRVSHQSDMLLARHRNLLENLGQQLKRHSMDKITEHKQRLKLAETTVKYVDPVHVLSRGYSIAKVNGKVIKRPEDVVAGDVIETVLVGGSINSVVTE